MRNRYAILLIAFVAALAGVGAGAFASPAKEGGPQLPVKAEVFIEQFRGSEGLTFNSEGKLFIGGNNSVWIAEPDGKVTKIADVHRHLGQAGIGKRDILAADFGPTNVFADGPNDDGMVWRITPEGKKELAATGIADANVVLVLPDKSFLVSDDGTDKIYRVKDGKTAIWTTAVQFPNGMALSKDEKTLYVAQTFNQLKPIVPDNRIWAIELKRGFAPGAVTLAATIDGKGMDGLVADEHGRIYVADNGGGKVWRFDPATKQVTLICDNVPAVASLVFGEGKFDQKSIYATSTMRGGGKIYKIPVGARGGKIYR